MNKILLFLAAITAALPAFSQKKITAEIEKAVTTKDVQGPLTFLAADEMRGRQTGSPELDIAANYIAAHFLQLGLKQLPGAPGYFQPVGLEKTPPANSGEIKVNNEVFPYKDFFVVMNEARAEWEGEFVYVGYGAPDETPNVKGKMVVSIAGARDSKGVNAIYFASGEKLDRMKAGGAAGLIEIFASPQIPWPGVVNYFSKNSKTTVKAESPVIPHLWMKQSESPAMAELIEQKKATGSLKIQRPASVPVPAKNVVGMIEGSDAVLKNEHIVISAHYDHVGVGAKKQNDSIYNGARDNALGTVAMMTAATYFSKVPPKRSIIFIALTAEEAGLLGSEWYAAHPLVPLKQTVFDLDCDGAGYNDTSTATIIGLEKTDADIHMMKGCEAFGLKAGFDPVPEQNLYERSDNYNFAKMGVPAVDFAPGVKSFDEAITKYYHQPPDEVGSLDFVYLEKFYRAFVYTAHLLAHAPHAPYWKTGDKYEPLGKTLYGK